MANLSVVTKPAPAADPHMRARLIVGGPTKGRTGKTTFFRALIETSPKHRRLRILDLEIRPEDRLSDYLPDVERPPSSSPVDSKRWLEEAIQDQAEKAADPATAYDMIIDFPGGDITLKGMGRELRIVGTLKDAGVDITAIYAVGPSVADLSELRDLESSKLFCPDRTVIVLNEGVVPSSQSAVTAFAPIITSDFVRGITSPSRGGKIVTMPALTCMPEIEDAKIKLFSDCTTAESRGKIGMFNSVRVKNWMERDIAELRKKLGEWVP